MLKTCFIGILVTGLIFGQSFFSITDPAEYTEEKSDSELLQASVLFDEIILEEPVDPAEYFVGPGDKFSFNMVSADGVANLLLQVSPTGDVLIPVVGTVQLNGLTLADAFDAIRKKCHSLYPDASIYLTLAGVRLFKVLVTGTVDKPGFVPVHALMRVSDVYEQVVNENGVHSEESSFNHMNDSKIARRNIKLFRDGELMKVDLVRFNMSGDTNCNPRLRQGDVLSIGLVDETVGIYGGVKLPGIYEYVKGEKLVDLISLAGGFTNNSDSARIEITRFINDTEKELIQFNSVEDYRNTLIMPEDHIVVRQKRDYKRQELVTVSGEVKYPGQYSIEVGKTTIGDIIMKAGGLSLRADSSRVMVNNVQIASLKDIEMERISLIPYEDRSDAEKAYVKARLRVSKGLISSSTREFTNDIMQYPLQISDVISIPPMQEYVEVLGAVVFPGRYPLISEKTVEDYIRDAGGITKQASRQRYIVKNNTGQRIPFDENMIIENGDVLFIAEKLEYNRWTRFQEFMTVSGQMAAIILVIQNALGR